MPLGRVNTAFCWLFEEMPGRGVRAEGRDQAQSWALRRRCRELGPISLGVGPHLRSLA